MYTSAGRCHPLIPSSRHQGHAPQEAHTLSHPTYLSASELSKGQELGSSCDSVKAPSKEHRPHWDRRQVHGGLWAGRCVRILTPGLHTHPRALCKVTCGCAVNAIPINVVSLHSRRPNARGDSDPVDTTPNFRDRETKAQGGFSIWPNSQVQL